MIDILLSTFNGEKYLEEQLNSIVNQTFKNWILLIRDDGSSDSTITIIERFVNKYPQNIFLFNDLEGNIGYTLSFKKLLHKSDADYIMFCDQDDVWNENKVEVLYNFIKQEELLNNTKTKAHVAFADLTIVDKSLKFLNKSYLTWAGYNHSFGQQAHFLRNFAPGCNIIFNKVLKEKSFEVENLINSHDHIIMLLAASIGKVSCINTSLMLYRIHGENSVGIRPKSKLLIRGKIAFKDCLKYIFQNKNYRVKIYYEVIAQVKEIRNKLPYVVSKETIFFDEISTSSFFKRKYYNIFKPFISHLIFTDRITYIICF